MNIKSEMSQLLPFKFQTSFRFYEQTNFMLKALNTLVSLKEVTYIISTVS